VQEVADPASVGAPRAASTSTIGLANQTAIIEALRTQGPMSKARLGALTGLSPATVNRLTALLIGEGLVAHHGVEASSGGRPPVILAVVGSALVVAALQIHPDRVEGALVDFDGVIVERVEQAIPLEGSSTGLDVTHAVLGELRAAAAARDTPVRAIGIALAGIVDAQGRISGLDSGRWPPLTVDQLTAGQTVPVIVENDANALALGELHRGVGRATPHFVTLLLDRGLGAGIVVNGAPYRGARAAAGEVGYLLVESSSSRPPQDAGDLEARISATEITAQARAAGLQPDRELTAMEIIGMARAGERRAAAIADRVLDELARAVAALASILDPEYVVLGEGLDRESDLVTPALEERLTGRIQRVPSIVTASLGTDAVLLGAAEMAIRAANVRTANR
jgi:predicted NBD/HSP70 family sugar kinase